MRKERKKKWDEGVRNDLFNDVNNIFYLKWFSWCCFCQSKLGLLSHTKHIHTHTRTFTHKRTLYAKSHFIFKRCIFDCFFWFEFKTIKRQNFLRTPKPTTQINKPTNEKTKKTQHSFHTFTIPPPQVTIQRSTFRIHHTHSIAYS